MKTLLRLAASVILFALAALAQTDDRESVPYYTATVTVSNPGTAPFVLQVPAKSQKRVVPWKVFVTSTGNCSFDQEVNASAATGGTSATWTKLTVQDTPVSTLLTAISGGASGGSALPRIAVQANVPAALDMIVVFQRDISSVQNYILRPVSCTADVTVNVVVKEKGR